MQKSVEIVNFDHVLSVTSEIKKLSPFSKLILKSKNAKVKYSCGNINQSKTKKSLNLPPLSKSNKFYITEYDNLSETKNSPIREKFNENTFKKDNDVETKSNISSIKNIFLPNIANKRKLRKRNEKIYLSPKEAIEKYKGKLTEFEVNEVFDFEYIYFVGETSKKLNGNISLSPNYGYDDENGNYIKVLHDQINYRYEIIYELGKGSFGQVVRSYDHKNDKSLAIKIIRNKKRFHYQAQVEVKILETLRRYNKRDNDRHHIVNMLDYFYFRNHLCITFELMGMNLYEYIKKNNYNGFNMLTVHSIATQLLDCLKLLYENKIIHCDLKPENILLNKSNQLQIKVIDFGSSCYESSRVYTYIQSRFYRSPEIILGESYTMSIDMWSFACILAEVHTGRPIFPGENELEQLLYFIEVFGYPSHAVLKKSSRSRLFFDSKGRIRCATNSKGKRRWPNAKLLSNVLKTNDENFINFMQQCFQWDSKKRLKPKDASSHPWITNINDRFTEKFDQMNNTDCRSIYKEKVSHTPPFMQNVVDVKIDTIQITSYKIIGIIVISLLFITCTNAEANNTL
ncbi:Dual specificity tyrosine-phosphorylation-regulated kinase 4, partial [Intoshia linei]